MDGCSILDLSVVIIIQDLQCPGSKIWNQGNALKLLFNSIIKDCSVAHAISFVDVGPVELFDGLHPNTLGHKRIFDVVYSVVERQLFL